MSLALVWNVYKELKPVSGVLGPRLTSRSTEEIRKTHLASVMAVGAHLSNGRPHGRKSAVLVIMVMVLGHALHVQGVTGSFITDRRMCKGSLEVSSPIAHLSCRGGADADAAAAVRRGCWR